MSVLAFAHVAFLLYGFLGVAFTSDFFFVVGVVLLIAFLPIWTAHFLETSPTISYVFHVRYAMSLVFGAFIGAMYVHVFRLRDLIDTRILHRGRKFPLTFMSFMTLFLFFFTLTLIVGIFYLLGFYDEPTLGLNIGNGAPPASTIAGPVVTSVSALVILLIFYGMATKETSGIGASTAKYYFALILIVAVPVLLYDLGSEDNAIGQPFTPPAQGFAALSSVALLWVLFYFYATGGAFTKQARTYAALAGKIRDPLFRHPQRAARFVVAVGGTHFVMFLVGWILDDTSDKDLHIMFYASVGIGLVISVFAVCLGVANNSLQSVERNSAEGTVLKTRFKGSRRRSEH